MIISFVKIWTNNKLLILIWSAISSLLAVMLNLSLEDFPVLLVSQLTKIWLLKTSLVLLLLTIGLTLSLFILYLKTKDKIKLEEFTFVDPPGYLTHPKYPYPICPSCLNKTPKLISPVAKVENAWYCTVCDKPMSGSRGEVFTIEDQY
jgi:hypothetical protein